jgi:hypothetical protein
MRDEPEARERLQNDGGQRKKIIRKNGIARSEVPSGQFRLAAGTEEKERDTETGAEQNGRGENVQRLDGEIAAYVIAPGLAPLYLSAARS